MVFRPLVLRLSPPGPGHSVHMLRDAPHPPLDALHLGGAWTELSWRPSSDLRYIAGESVCLGIRTGRQKLLASPCLMSNLSQARDVFHRLWVWLWKNILKQTPSGCG